MVMNFYRILVINFYRILVYTFYTLATIAKVVTIHLFYKVTTCPDGHELLKTIIGRVPSLGEAQAHQIFEAEVFQGISLTGKSYDPCGLPYIHTRVGS